MRSKLRNQFRRMRKVADQMERIVNDDDLPNPVMRREIEDQLTELDAKILQVRLKLRHRG